MQVTAYNVENILALFSLFHISPVNDSYIQVVNSPKRYYDKIDIYVKDTTMFLYNIMFADHANLVVCLVVRYMLANNDSKKI